MTLHETKSLSVRATVMLLCLPQRRASILARRLPGLDYRAAQEIASHQHQQRKNQSCTTITLVVSPQQQACLEQPWQDQPSAKDKAPERAAMLLRRGSY